MSGLEGIPVHIEAAGLSGTVGNVRAILAELETALTELLSNGHEHSIDLRSLPFAPGELEYLKDVLGAGEVRVEIDALGKSTIIETAIRGVWWVTHYNTLDDRMAEFLEISFCPDLVRAHRDDVRESLELLNARLAEDG